MSICINIRMHLCHLRDEKLLVKSKVLGMGKNTLKSLKTPAGFVVLKIERVE